MKTKVDNWKHIWENRQADQQKLESRDIKEVFMELKRLTGNDTVGGKGIGYEAYLKQFAMTRREMSFSPLSDLVPNSYFEVGCGSGALLFLLQHNIDGTYEKITIGGMDYSSSLIEAAKKVLDNPRELYCAEAIELDISMKYDCVFSYSAFEYFIDYDYAKAVMEKMLIKSNFSIAILDIHDSRLSEAYDAYRRTIIPDYDKKYADLKKLFYDKTFFIDFANEHRLDIKFTSCRLDGYWNAPYTYDVYFYKDINN